VSPCRRLEQRADSCSHRDLPSHSYFGKVGMRHFHLTRNSHYCPTVNIDKLWSLVPASEKADFPKQTGELVPVVDTLALGYGKVLGKGRLPDLPLIVKARFVSELAEKKIKEAGGCVVLVA
jgi:large subunit ribosomal protein L27Ae